jgi:ribosomal protein L14E/L6E/L27E
MEFVIGQVVRAIAGRDSENFFAVLGEKDGKVLIVDGKSRKTAVPKAKNPKHLRKTNTVLPESELTDKKLRQALSRFNGD